MAEIPLTMPKMSMTMEEGTLTEWSVAEGDTVAKGDVVAIVMTDKVDMEVESAAAGTVVKLLVGEGDVVPVGEPIAMVSSEEEELLGNLFAPSGDDASASPDNADAQADEAEAEAAVGDEPGSDANLGTEPSATAAGSSPTTDATPDGPMPPTVPLARKLAKDAGLDLRAVTATGPHGTVRVKDVKEALADTAASYAETSDDATRASNASAPAISSGAVAATVVAAGAEELLGDVRSRRTRQLTAQAMEPTTTIPQFTAYRTMDLSASARARTGVLRGVSWTTLIVRAYSIVLRQNEQLNGFWARTGVKRNDHVGVTLAVDTPGGLMIPVLRDPDQLALRDLDGQIRGIAADAKDGKVDPSLFSGGTGTVSNLGSLGIDRFNALITPPQATALSVGSVGYRPVIDADGTVSAQTFCELGLSLDHRIADGADAARALQSLQDLLADPLQLAL